MCREKQRLFESISLSANAVVELVDHALGKTQGHIQKVFKIWGVFSCKSQQHRYCEVCCFDPRVSDEFQVTDELILLDPSKRKARTEFVCQLLVLLNRLMLC
jgi:hypothetical protein